MSLATTSYYRMSKERERVDRDARNAHFEMEVRSGAIAGRSHQRDRLSRRNHVAWLDQRPIEVCVERAQLWVVHHHDVEAVSAALPVHRDQPPGRGVDWGVKRRRQVDATVEVTARAGRRRWLDLEGRTSERLRQDGVAHRHEQRAHLSLLRLHHHAGHQQRHPEERRAGGEQRPSPGPGEEGDASRGQHGYALEAWVVAPIAPLTAFLPNPSARCWALVSRCE